MEQKRNNPSASAGTSDRRSAMMLKKRSLKRQQTKVDRLMQLYKEIRAEIKRLESREIPLGEDYDEDVEEAANSRLLRLISKRLRIHDYFVRKRIFVGDEGEPLDTVKKPRLMITSTGIEDLNTQLTDYVNHETDCDGFEVRLPYRHVTVGIVKELIEEMGETNDSKKLFPEDPEEFERLVENIACEVNKQVKQYIENYHKAGLDDWEPFGPAEGSENVPSASALASDAEEKVEQPVNVPTWDAARMELKEACDRGELGQEPESSGDADDTAMGLTNEEIEDEQEEEIYREEVEGDADESENDVGSLSSDMLDSDSAGSESGDSCCIIDERMREREKSNDSDCRIIDDDGDKLMSVDEEVADDEAENNEADSAGGNEKTTVTREEDAELDKKGNDDDNDDEDDDCCIIEG